MNRVLVVGADGLVGSHIHQALVTERHGVLATGFAGVWDDIQRLDIRSATAVDRLCESAQPATIYLAAGLTNVDYCESHPEESYAVNVTGAGNVVQAANRVGATVVFFSSDYIFNGVSGPYGEDDTPDPLSVYGHHKVLAELVVSEVAHHWLIVRTTVVYGWERQGKNFVYRLRQALQQRQPITVPTDQLSSPTYAPTLASTVLQLVKASATGVFNVAGTSLASRYEFACEIAAALGHETALIQPSPTHALGQVAQRPLKAGLRVDKVQAALSIRLPGYQTELQAMMRERMKVP